MEYGRILKEAWRLTWRNKFLWFFGLFVSSSTCGGSYGGTGDDFNLGESFGNGTDFSTAFEDLGGWLAANAGLVVAAFLLFMLFLLVVIVLSCIAHGALIGGLARLSAGEPVTFGSAWRQGTRLAWRYVRLWLLFFLVVIGGLAVFGVLGAVLFAIGSQGGGAVALAILVGVVLFFALLAALVFFSVVVMYSERAVAVDDMGARRALARGLALFRVRLGHSVVLWLIALVIGIVAGAAIVTAAILLALPLGALVFGSYLAQGLAGPTIALGGLALVLFVALLWGLAGVVNTYTAAYWTLAYLALTDRFGAPAPAAEPSP